jgi:biotin operon repressor
MATDQEQALLQFFQAVGQPERLKMLGMMANKPYSVSELAYELGLKETAVSHHLRRLQKMGLVIEDSRQFTYTYQLDNTALKQLEQYVIDGKKSDYFEQAVLKQHLKGDRIQRIPADKKEREVIVRWLAEQFEIEKQYSEDEIDEIILRHYPSHKMLKRYLRDRRYLKVAKKTYWRPKQEA